MRAVTAPANIAVYFSNCQVMCSYFCLAEYPRGFHFSVLQRRLRGRRAVPAAFLPSLREYRLARRGVRNTHECAIRNLLVRFHTMARTIVNSLIWRSYVRRCSVVTRAKIAITSARDFRARILPVSSGVFFAKFYRGRRTRCNKFRDVSLGDFTRSSVRRRKSPACPFDNLSTIFRIYVRDPLEK